jgi:hypothetical protein
VFFSLDPDLKLSDVPCLDGSGAITEDTPQESGDGPGIKIRTYSILLACLAMAVEDWE